MKTGIVFISLFTALSIVALVSSSAQAAKSPAMEACSKQWGDMKAAGQTVGQTWPDFWSQCSKDFVAKNGSEVAAPAKSAKAEKESKKPTQAPTVGMTTFSSCPGACDLFLNGCDGALE